MTKGKKSRTWRWVTRSKYEPYVEVHLTAKQPTELDPGYFEWGAYTVCCKEFRRIFGFTIPQGKCLKVEFSAKVVK